MDVQQDVHALLKGKSRCLAQILEISRLFLESAEASPESVIDLTADFDRKRSDAFQALELIDRKIDELSQTLSASSGTHSSFRAEAQAILLEHRGLGRTLQEIDSKIFRLIEVARQSLAREVSDQTRLKDKLSKFKSQWMPDQGEGLDQTL